MFDFLHSICLFPQTQNPALTMGPPLTLMALKNDAPQINAFQRLMGGMKCI